MPVLFALDLDAAAACDRVTEAWVLFSFCRFVAGPDELVEVVKAEPMWLVLDAERGKGVAAPLLEVAPGAGVIALPTVELVRGR